MSQRRFVSFRHRSKALRCALLLGPAAFACAKPGQLPVRYADTAPGAEPYPAVTQVPAEALAPVVVAPVVVTAPADAPKATDVLNTAVQQQTPAPTPLVTRASAPLAHLGSDEAAVRFVGNNTCLVEFAGATTLFHPTGLVELVKAALPKPAAGKKGAKASKPAPLSLGTEKIEYVAVGQHGVAGIGRATALALWRQFHPTFLVPAKGAAKAQLLGYGIPKANVRELRDYADTPLNGGHLSAALVPGPEAAARAKQPKHAKQKAIVVGPAGFVLSDGHRHLYFAGPGKFGSQFEQVHNRYGAPDVSVLNIAAGKDAAHKNASALPAEDARKAQLLLNSPVVISLPQLESLPTGAAEQGASHGCLITPRGEETLLVALGRTGPCEMPSAKAASSVPTAVPAAKEPAPAAAPQRSPAPAPAPAPAPTPAPGSAPAPVLAPANPGAAPAPSAPAPQDSKPAAP